MADYRDELHALVAAFGEHGGKWPQENEDALHAAVSRARALLDQQEPEGPTDEELVNFRNRVTADCCTSRSNNGANLLSGGDFFECQAAGLRAVLARWGRLTPQPPADGEVADESWYPDFADWLEREMPEGTVIGDPLWWASKIADRIIRIPTPQPPADGEVAELVETLKGIAYWRRHGKPGRIVPGSFDIRQADRLDRIADLLQHQHPQPVAVSERLPGPGDCLDEGWAWFFNQRIGWRQAVLPVSPSYTHWLPANALPTPEATNA